MKISVEQQRTTQFDRLAIADVILRERTARDQARWEEMASYYHPDSIVEVSWFKGSGATFVARSKARYLSTRERSDEIHRVNFHQMGVTTVTVAGDRAIAESPCTLHGFFPLDGIDAKLDAYVRLHWRAHRFDGKWLIAGLRCVYTRDLMAACNPGRKPVLKEKQLAQYRTSYRYATYNLAVSGLEPQNDLPGVDQPETVTAIEEAELAWLTTM